MIGLPNFLSLHSVPQYRLCDGVSPSFTYQSSELLGLRDLNGDGIPDFVDGDRSDGSWHVRFGTGTRFGTAKPIDVADGQFAPSQETENCGGTRSGTTRGLYDIDGDDQPEVVALSPDGARIDIYQLNGTYQPDMGNLPSAPEAGRLVKIADGHDAIVTISYRSAKEDFTTYHNVPFPEIVVASVGTHDESGAALEAPTLYAYGDARLNYDPKYDAFIFAGYKRRVELRLTSDQVAPRPTDGLAHITDTYLLVPFDEGMDSDARFRRYLKAGRVSDVTTISGNVGTDPWAVLDTNLNIDPRRIGGAHYDWDTRILPTGTSVGDFCFDMVYPYDYRRSRDFVLDHLDADSDQCMVHGFVFQKSASSWRGSPGTGSPYETDRAVVTLSEVESVDGFGRVLAATQRNDSSRPDDDLCVQTVYANPVGSKERVLSAPASSTITNCASPPVTLAKDTWEYDTSGSGVTLPPESVSSGLVTGRSVSRIRIDDGSPILGADGTGDIRAFNAVYDPSTGNPVTITMVREDGAAKKVTVAYDPFGLAPVSIQTEAANGNGTALPLLRTTIKRDELTLDALSTTDPDGTQGRHTFDGFGRVLLLTVAPPGGTAGALSSVGYLGFAVGEAGGWRVVSKSFTDPVPANDVATAVGRTATTFLDALGRVVRTEVPLGADYGNQTLVTGSRFYDKLGRVWFEADPYPLGQNINDQYGTTYHYKVDGTPACFIRGKGFQPLGDGAGLTLTDEGVERYPTCFERVFLEHAEKVSRMDPDAMLPGSPQHSVERAAYFTAIGRPIQAVTHGPQGVPKERATFGYDALGHRTNLTRYQDPAPVSPSEISAGSKPVTIAWHYDSLGHVLELDEPDSAAQFRSYSNWGEPVQVQWCDATTSPCTDRRTLVSYDALGRLMHGEDRTGGAVDVDTVNDYTYDQPANFVNSLVPAHLLGRLASASWPTGRVSFSYDGLGRVDGLGFDDAHGNTYVEKHTYHADGSPSELHLLLPDTGFKDERVDYAYDSAGRLRTGQYSEAGGPAMLLFSLDGIDLFGRIRQARMGLFAPNGPASYAATYADTGRRLLQDVKVGSATAAGSREISYLPIPGTAASVAAYDPLGRERVRQEAKDGTAPASLSTYDAMGRLDATSSFDGTNGVTAKVWQFDYDSLGNILAQADLSSPASPGGVMLGYRPTDRDRICSIGYGSAAPDPVCDVKYDGQGNIIEQKSRTNGTRKLEYFANGRVKKIADGTGNVATFRYDAFGAVQQLDLDGDTPDTRHDRHFGALIAVRDETADGGTTTPVITRTVPGPGFSATRHGPAGPWIFALRDGRGNCFFLEGGEFVQDVGYRPYGEATSTGQMPHSTRYSSEQWNGGDALSALGLSHLGARIYDPVIGRFLSRDPLLVTRTAATTNPYAFAMNDPINSADPTGLDNGAECPICSQPTPFDPLPGFLPGFPGGPQHPSGDTSKPGRPINGAVVPAKRLSYWEEKAYRDEVTYRVGRARDCLMYHTTCEDPDPDVSVSSMIHDAFGSAMGSMFFFAGVPSYYVKTEVPRFEMQRAQTGVEYFEARDRYMTARVKIALSRVNEEAGRYTGATMELSGAMLSFGGGGGGGARSTYVYQLVDEAGDPVYFGISKDYRILRRLNEHSEAWFVGGFRGMQIISEPLYEVEAKLLETQLIQAFEPIFNTAESSIRAPFWPIFTPTPTRPSATMLNPALFPWVLLP